MVGGALVTLDRVEVLEGLHVVERFAEVEAELIDGDTGGLARVERRLRQAGARPTNGQSKLARVLRGKLDASGQPGPQAPALDHFRAYVRRQLDEIVRHDPVVRVDGDPEAVHEMRVAVRRLRAVLRVARPMLQRRWADELRAELDWVAKALGPVRDLDVLSAYLTQEVASLDAGDAILGARLLAPLAEQGRSARAALMVALESDRYLAVLDSVEAAAEAPPLRRADLSLEKMAKKEFRKLRDQVRSLGDDPSSADLHKARIRGKRARYAAELVSITAEKRARRFVKAATKFQDALGEHQDAVVTERKLRELVQLNGHRDGTVAAGRLIERQNERKKAARARYPKSWKRLKRAGKRAWN
jgi:CHAD domain-containing protein